MSMRERALAVLKGQQPDKVPWFGDLSYWVYWLESTGQLPEQYRGDGVFQLHRDLGVGFYLQGYFPFTPVYDGVEIRHQVEGGIRVTTVETPVGKVREVWKHLPDSFTWGPQEHFVKNVEDLKVIRWWYEHTRYEPDYGVAAARREILGDNGLVLCYLPRSPLMQMVAEMAGIEATTFAMLDTPEELEETLEVMRVKADEAAALALDSPAECLMIPENLSSEVVGKSFYHQFMEPYEVCWNQKIKQAGKYSYVHMDGTMKGLIRETSAAGFRVLEALTPAPVGDIPIGEIHQWVQPDTVIWGGVPGTYFTDLVTDAEFDAFVLEVLEVMKSQPRYVLGVADQVPPGVRWERIRRVGELVDQYGRYV